MSQSSRENRNSSASIDEQTTFKTYVEFAAERAAEPTEPTLVYGSIETADVETGTDRRVDRALTECFHVTHVGAGLYDVESGSGKTYSTDLFDPDSPECDCVDEAPGGYCKHVWYILLFVYPDYLTDRIYGLGSGR